jgi:hypothetical protein
MRTYPIVGKIKTRRSENAGLNWNLSICSDTLPQLHTRTRPKRQP